MNINSQGHLLTFVEGHSESTFSNVFCLETGKPIEDKFYMEPPWDEGMKINANGLCHMTKIAAMLIYGNQRTNAPVNAHLISGPTISTKTSFAKFDIVVKCVKVNSGSSFIYTL